MVEYQVIFNTSYDPDNSFVGIVKQYSDNQYKLKVYLPDSFDTGFQISANIQRDDEAVGSYALTFNTDHFVLDFGAWATAISGELKITIQAVNTNEDVFVFKTITLNVEDTVAVSDYDPDIDSPEYTSIISALAGKQPLDGDLTAIANLSASSGVLTKIGANNWALSNQYFELVDGLIPAEYLPTYVDDVIEGILVNSTSFTVGGTPITPESGKIYVSTANEKVYRWSGSLYVEISSQITVGNLTGQAFDGALGKQAFDNASLSASWGNHANAGYLLANSTTITDIQNNATNLSAFANDTFNEVSNLSGDVSDLGNLVATINGSYLTANSSTITNIVNSVNAVNSNVSNLSNVVANKVDTSLLGQVNGVATLDGDGKVPTSQLPSYVDDVVEYADLASFPVSGETSKIYVALDTNLTYRWSGSAYVEISQSLALGNTSATAFRGDLGKEAYDWGNHANVGYLTAEADTLNTVATRGNTTNAISVNYVSTLQTAYNTTADYGGVNKGELGFSTQYGTLQLGLGNGGSVQVGQTEMYYGKATENITKGQVVMFNGAQGDFIKISLANPSVLNNNPDYMLGIAPTNITNDTFGYVTKFGYIDELPTNGFTNGTILWFDSNTSNASGGYTDIKPVAPNVKIQLAAVVKASSTPSSTNGRLLVRVATGSQLGGTDSNVELVNVANGEVLAYNGTSLRWENKEVVSLGLNVALTNIANDQYLAYSNGTWVNRDLVTYGTVNSVGITTTTTGLTVNGTVTNTGNLSVDVASGYVIPTTTEQTNWNSAYSWGNHQAVGYIVGLANGTVTSDNIALWNGTTGKLLKDSGVAISSILTSESDPVFTASNAFGITGTDIGNWNTAYGWGNHANAGYGNVVGAGTVTSGNIVTYNGTTGTILSTGLTLETTRTNSSTAVPTSHAVANYVTGLGYQTGSGTVQQANTVRDNRSGSYLYVWQGTQAQYDAIGTKNSLTLYFVTA